LPVIDGLDKEPTVPWGKPSRFSVHGPCWPVLNNRSHRRPRRMHDLIQTRRLFFSNGCAAFQHIHTAYYYYY